MDYKQRSGLEIAALVLGIVSIPLGCLFAIFGILAGVAGIILYVFARRAGCAPGMSTAGLVCSIIGIVTGSLNILGGILLLYAVFTSS